MTSAHWLDSSVLEGAVGMVSLDVDVNAELVAVSVVYVELVVADLLGELPVLVVNVQPAVSVAATTIAVSNHR
ncbi:MAG: hypothetical protein JO236_16650 [Mycobacterium sp.]|uniref:hypothetical protein n=1 Tax=Mycobacterium sp. TaxID=1785 RepID=UPI001EC81A76|nr:hypothetical protein [Mycobacterium sp.]MBW0019158.1 hypothetical protein [Mycobacterium sp.]